MANVVVAENHLKFNGITYFRAQSEEAEIGSIGEKRTPISKQNYLEVKDRIPVPKIDIATATVVEIDSKRSSKKAFGGKIFAIIKGVPVKLDGGSTYEKLLKNELKLVKFSVSNAAMIKAANKSPRKINSLIEWGNDARIVHQVFVVMDSTEARQFKKNTKVELSVGVKGLEAKLKGGGSASGTQTVSISKGTCFAYLLAKIDWDAKQKKNKTKIVDLDDDQWSFS